MHTCGQQKLSPVACVEKCDRGFIDTISMFQAYDQHLNMILGEVEETVTTMEIDEETYEEIYKVMDTCYFYVQEKLMT